MLRVPVLPAPPPSLGPHGSDRGVRVAFVPVALPIGLSSWAARVASTVPQSLGPVPQRCHKPHGARPGERAISRDPSAAHSVSCFPTSADPSPLASCLTPGCSQNRLPCPSHGSHQAARGTPRGCPGSGSLCPNLPVQPARDPPELPSFPHSRQDPLWAAPPPPPTRAHTASLTAPPHTPWGPVEHGSCEARRTCLQARHLPGTWRVSRADAAQPGLALSGHLFGEFAVCEGVCAAVQSLCPLFSRWSPASLLPHSQWEGKGGQSQAAWLWVPAVRAAS